jgi:hypothetical protein
MLENNIELQFKFRTWIVFVVNNICLDVISKKKILFWNKFTHTPLYKAQFDCCDSSQRCLSQMSTSSWVDVCFDLSLVPPMWANIGVEFPAGLEVSADELLDINIFKTPDGCESLETLLYRFNCASRAAEDFHTEDDQPSWSDVCLDDSIVLPPMWSCRREELADVHIFDTLNDSETIESFGNRLSAIETPDRNTQRKATTNHTTTEKYIYINILRKPLKRK